MGRLIEIEPALQPLPATITIRRGDVLRFAASGGDVQSGNQAVERVGAFRSGVLGANGLVLTPAGGPDVVLFMARQSGTAVVRIVTGDPWGKSASSLLEVRVED